MIVLAWQFSHPPQDVQNLDAAGNAGVTCVVYLDICSHAPGGEQEWERRAEMPFDAAEVARQIHASLKGAHAEAEERESAVEYAVRLYRAVDSTAWEQRVQDAVARRWVGAPLTPLNERRIYAPTVQGYGYCVVATDSSFVPPDKHRGAFCHLINVGRVMVRYGNMQAAEIDNTPNHYPEVPLQDEDTVSSKVLATKCALRELEELYEWASRYRAAVALVDGSLMQLVNVLSKDAEVSSLMRSYFRVLQAFQQIRVPVVGYISRPESQMVMRAIRMLACELPAPHETRPDDECTCSPLWSITDADLFERLLGEGELSPVWEPVFSHLVGENAGIVRDMVFAYLGTEYEVARLEFPAWVWQEKRLESMIACILDQCRLGQGYPNALTLAHQYAVLHNADREGYYFLLERAGLMRKTTEKAQGKRMIGQAI